MKRNPDVSPIKASTALIENYVAAGLLPALKKWALLLDEYDHPMILYLETGENPRLCLLRKDDLHGQMSAITDFETLKTSVQDGYPLQAHTPPFSFIRSTDVWIDFTVSQNPETKVIALCLQGAVNGHPGPAGISVTEDLPNFHLISPCMPHNLYSGPLDKLYNVLVGGGPADIARATWGEGPHTMAVDHLEIPMPSMPESFPCAVFALRNDAGLQTAMLNWDNFPGLPASKRLPRWSQLLHPFQLRADINSSPELYEWARTCGRWNGRHGIFSLNGIRQDMWHLPHSPQFTFIDSEWPAVPHVNLPIPLTLGQWAAGAKCFISLIKSPSTVVSTTIRWYSLMHLFPNYGGTAVPIFWHDNEIARFQTAQHGDSITAWLQFGRDDPTMFSFQFSYDTMRNGGYAISCLPSLKPFIRLISGEDMRFACSAPSGDQAAPYTHHVLIASEESAANQTKVTSFKSASQAGGDGIWVASQNFVTIPNVQKMVKFTSHTTQFTFAPDFAHPDHSGASHLVALTVLSNIPANFYINGTRVGLGPGRSYNVNIPRGTALTVVEESVDLSGCKLTVTWNRSDGTKPSLTIEPSLKINDKIATLKDEDYHAMGVSAEQNLTDTRKMMEQLAKHHQKLTQPTALPLAMISAVEMSVSRGLLEDIREGWHYVCDELTKVELKIEEVVGTGLKLVYQFGRVIRELVIETIDDISRAVHAVLNAIGAAWDKMVSFFGAVFHFEEIKSRALLIEQSMSQALNVAKIVVDSAVDDAKDWLEAELHKAKGRLHTMLQWDDEQSDHAVSGVNQYPAANKDDESGVHTIQTSPKLSIISGSVNSKGIDVQIEQLPRRDVDDKTKSSVSSITHTSQLAQDFEQLKDDVRDLFHTGVSIKAGMRLLEKVIDMALDLAAMALEAALDVIRYLFDQIIDMLLCGIEVPMLSPLIRLCMGEGNDGKIHLLRVFSFIMATVSVELELIGLLPTVPAGETTDYGVNHFTEAANKAPDFVRGFFKSTDELAQPTPPGSVIQPSSVIPATRPQMFFEAPSASTTGFDPNGYFGTYPGTCAIMHPVVVAVNLLFSGARSGLRLANSTVEKELDGFIFLIDGLDIIRIIADVASSIPVSKTATSLRYASLGCNIFSMVVINIPWSVKLASRWGWGIEALEGGSLKRCCTVLGTGFYLAGVGTMSGALAVWQNTADTAEGSWPYERRSLDLTIGNVISGAFGSLGRAVDGWYDGIAEYIAILPRPWTVEQDAAFIAAEGTATIGCGIDFITVIPDLICDAIKAKAEKDAFVQDEKDFQEKKDQTGKRGGYMGCLHR